MSNIENESIHSSEDQNENPKFNNYKVGNKKSVQEYEQLDQQDESLAKWKKSLGLSADMLPLEFANDNRQVVVKRFELVDLKDSSKQVLDFPQYKTESEINDFLKNYIKATPIKIKESSVFQIKIFFKIQKEIITGLRYQQNIKKAGISLDKLNNQLGSYAPSTQSQPEYSITLPEIEAPSGFLGRGSYSIVSKFVDDDKVNHLTLNWGVEITKWAN